MIKLGQQQLEVTDYLQSPLLPTQTDSRALTATLRYQEG
jgi:hypothetical protein